ncbi:hypothetical protein E2C01_094281 [Portunus trituberculatus]|uniref:Uncharacterized protein n=1 Tax=Portunus trituberculatus TaxID=210409 RepID=A0A5B7JWG3_PORTR|nr:hypothetical protein [Portunus trituberculatus]
MKIKIKPLVYNTPTTHSLVQNINNITVNVLNRLNLPPKRSAMWPSVSKKTRKSLTLEVKLDIIHRHERQENYSNAHHHLASIYCPYYFQVSRLY